MPTLQIFRGDAPAIAQVNTLTVGGTPATGQVYSVTINDKTYSYTALVSDTNTTITLALLSILQTNSESIPEFGEITWASPTATTITGTSVTPGIRFINTSGATGTGTLVTTSVAGQGPNDWDVAANWVSGSVPVTGDSVFLRGLSVNIFNGLNQSGVTLALLDIDSTYTGQIGLPPINTSGSTGTAYAEYRDQYLSISATIMNVGRGSGAGSNQIRVNVGTNICTLNIFGTATPQSPGGYSLDFLGTNAGNAVVASRGYFMVAGLPNSVSTIATCDIGSQTNINTDVVALLGDGCTLGTLLMVGGVVQVNNGATTVQINSGTLTLSGTAGVTTLTNNSGTFNYDSSGTIGTYVGGNTSLMNATRVNVARTMTNCTLNSGVAFRDTGKTITFGGSGIKMNCAISDLRELDLGEQFFLQRS
jgi:hypothetical protein